MKIKILMVAAGFIFSLNGLAQAKMPIPSLSTKQIENSEVTEKQKSRECNCEQREYMHKDWQEKMAEREQNLLQWVSEFTPDKKAEWKEVLVEKKSLRNQWLSPEFAEKREKWKQEKIERMKELKNQLEAGKITKEEFILKAHGGKNMSQWKTFHDLKVAVEAKNKEQASTLLNQLLEQAKQHNEKMKEMIRK